MGIAETRFDDNACVLLNNKGEMLGTRVNGVVSSALRDIPGGPDKGGRWAKVFALAQKVREILHLLDIDVLRWIVKHDR